jgi:hypothetical protein
MMKAYVATIYLLLHGKSEAEMCDAVSELLSGATEAPEHGYLIDWGYARADGKWLHPTEVPGVCLKDYRMGDFMPVPNKTDVDLLREMGSQHEYEASAVIYFDFEHVSASTLLFTDASQYPEECDAVMTIFYGFTVTILCDKNSGRATSCYGGVKVNLPPGLRDYESGWNDDVDMPADIHDQCVKDARDFAEKLRENIGIMIFVNGNNGEFYVAKGGRG